MIVSLPIGPLGLLSIQRTISKGWKTGFISGLGAAASDMIYSSIAILGVSFIDHFLVKHRSLVDKLSGVLFLIVGLNILINAMYNKNIKEKAREEILHPGFSNFLMGLSNPMTFIIFLALFTRMGVELNRSEVYHNIIFIISIFSGSLILWFTITNFIDRSKRNYKIEKFILFDKAVGLFIILVGIVNILKGIMRL